MTAERSWTLSDFDYDLPAELIAQQPAAVRGESRLLLVPRAGRREDGTAGGAGTAGRPPAGPPDHPVLADLRFPAIVDLIPPGDLLVLNSTRVRHARLLGTRPSGGPAEVLLLHPAAGDAWVAMGKPGSALRPGKRIALGDGIAVETVEVLADGHRVVRFVGGTAQEAIDRFGRLPLPPYIERDPTAEDEDRYQTVYARREGSVAAPTAGLHFTPSILRALHGKGVTIADLDLEVGPGTFKPVEREDITRHHMHAEAYEIPAALVRAIAETRARGGAVWAVGTTVVRALESSVGEDGLPRAGRHETRLFITPGFRFRVVDHLLTNFHLPRSTLVMLVAAFAGYATAMAAYRHAAAARYRFYSYGDAMVIVGGGTAGRREGGT